MAKGSSSHSERSRGAGRVTDVTLLLNEGRALHARGRVNEAFARYQAALVAAPEHPDALHMLGVAYLSMGHALLGMAFVRKAIAHRPEVADYRLNLATALAHQGQIDEAADQLQAASQLQPDDAEILAGLGGLQSQLNRFTDAELSYARAVEIDPKHAEWHEALARLRYLRWAMPEAMESAQRALSLSASVADRLNMGFALSHEPAPLPSPADLLVASPALTPADLARACDERDVLVIDDFLDDPKGFRAHALRLCEREGQRRSQANFPGVQTPAQPCGVTMQRIAHALARPLKWDSTDNGAVRLSVASDDARADVHIDNPSLPHIFGGVLYLSPPEHCRGGTCFYRHRATGWDRRLGEDALREGGYASYEDFQRRNLPASRRLPFNEWQRQRDTTWELLFEIPMRFNRLVVFRSDFFHAISELFGDSAENGRLVQLFHFESQS